MIRLILRCMDTMQSCSKAQVIFSIDWVSLLRAQHLHKMYIHSILTWPIFYIWIDPYIQKDVCVFVYYNVLFREKWDITGKKKKSMLSSVWASTMISLVIELSTRLINKQLSPPVYFLSSLDHCYLCFNNNSKKKKNSVKLFPIQADQVESICMNDFWLFRQCCFNAATQNWSFSITQREKQAAIESRAEHIWLQSCQHSQLDYD